MNITAAKTLKSQRIESKKGTRATKFLTRVTFSDGSEAYRVECDYHWQETGDLYSGDDATWAVESQEDAEARYNALTDAAAIYDGDAMIVRF